MYRIIFNFRSDGGHKLNQEVLKSCVMCIWSSVVKSGVKGLDKYRHLIFPMGQLSAGLFINLSDDMATNDDVCLELFGAMPESETEFVLETIKIADNYIRFKMLVEGIVLRNFDNLSQALI